MKYWSSFLRRNVDKLTTKYGQRFASDCGDWSKRSWVSQMYDEIYNTYIIAGVARPLETPCYKDMSGKNVSESLKYGEQIEIEMLHPNYVLFADETGLNTSSKDNGNKGGTKYVCGQGQIPKTKCTTSDGFTVHVCDRRSSHVLCDIPGEG